MDLNGVLMGKEGIGNNWKGGFLKLPSSMLKEENELKISFGGIYAKDGNGLQFTRDESGMEYIFT